MEEKQFEYRTGPTEPDKNNRKLTTVLLICVIVLFGMVSFLSISNARLTRLLTEYTQETAPLSFVHGDPTNPTASTNPTTPTLEGMSLQEPDPVYQHIHALPYGLYISHVEPGSTADAMGILPGDVLISCNGASVSSIEAFQNLQGSLVPGQEIPLVLCREGQIIPMAMTLSH